MTFSNNQIKNTIIQRCQDIGLKPDDKGYVSSIEENLVGLFENWDEIATELGTGAGNELKPDKYGKFKAVHSSSALCVNTFAPFKQHKDQFSSLNEVGFKEATFEKKLPTGLKGTSPHLDFYLENSRTCIGFESKFIETLGLKLPNKDNNLSNYQDRKELDYLLSSYSSLLEYYINYGDKLT